MVFSANQRSMAAPGDYFVAARRISKASLATSNLYRFGDTKRHRKMLKMTYLLFYCIADVRGLQWKVNSSGRTLIGSRRRGQLG